MWSSDKRVLKDLAASTCYFSPWQDEKKKIKEFWEKMSSEDKADGCIINQSLWIQLFEGIPEIEMILITAIIKPVSARWVL